MQLTEQLNQATTKLISNYKYLTETEYTNKLKFHKSEQENNISAFVNDCNRNEIIIKQALIIQDSIKQILKEARQITNSH